MTGPNGQWYEWAIAARTSGDYGWISRAQGQVMGGTGHQVPHWRTNDSRWSAHLTEAQILRC